jgi:MSHA biogenesis protein MshI
MRWPWKRRLSGDQLVLSWSAQTLAYVHARGTEGGAIEVVHAGIEHQGSDSMEAFVQRLGALHLNGRTASVMLRAQQYHLLQIPAPAVPADELKSAARYQIREMVDIHVDDLTLDVMHVGDGQQKNNPQLFVVAATNANVRAVMDLAHAMDWAVSVIDIQETCQRNLQTAMAQRSGAPEQADASMVIADDSHALITISAKGELYFTRRLELPEGFMRMAWSQGSTDVGNVPDGYTPVMEYVPDYSGAAATSGASTVTQSDADRAQRVVVELQRTLDLWDRTWSSLPLSGLRVYAGERSPELALWLTREIGQSVTALDLAPLFSGLEGISEDQRLGCVPLLGLLLRSED